MDIYSSGTGSGKSRVQKGVIKKKKAGLILLYVWLASLILLVISAIIFSSPGVSASLDLSGLIFLLFLIIVFLLPVWGFLLGNRLVKILVVIPASLVALFFVLYFLVMRPHKVIGGSMSPKFISGEYMLSEKVTYYFNSPKRGDVVVFISPTDKSQEFFARIVGLPGENIAIRSGHVYIDGKVLSEPYLQPGVVTDTGAFLNTESKAIPDSNYVIMGDNRASSFDSRTYGFVKRSKIESRIFYIYWPQDKTGLVK